MRILAFVFIAGLLVYYSAGFVSGALDPAIVLYFSFDNIEGNKVTDISGNGNDGSLNGTSSVDGKHGSALEFDGEDDHILVTPDATLDLFDAMTLMAWIYKTEFVAANNGETIISKNQSGADCLEVSGWENRFPEKFSAEPRISGTYHPMQSPDPVPLGRWVHVSITYDGDTIRMYVDGALVTEENAPGKIDINAANVYIGAESDGGQPDATHGRFRGLIDELIVANRAFSEDEINELMASGAAVEPGGKLPIVWGNIKLKF